MMSPVAGTFMALVSILDVCVCVFFLKDVGGEEVV
jgi:hypothetical protein